MSNGEKYIKIHFGEDYLESIIDNYDELEQFRDILNTAEVRDLSHIYFDEFCDEVSRFADDLRIEYIQKYVEEYKDE